MSIFAREFSFEDKPSTVPSSFWMPVAKLGITDKSAKLAWLACNTIFLIDIGIAGTVAVAGAAAASAAADFRPLRGNGGAGAGAAVAATGGLAPPLDATTVAPGAAK